MLKQFKEFAFKGNLVDMAVALILAAGFLALVKSFVTNCFIPALELRMGDVKFDNLKWVLKNEGTKDEITITWGKFVDEAIAFTLLAFVVFLIVKKVMTAMEKKKAEEEKPAETPKQEVLLEQILEQLKK